MDNAVDVVVIGAGFSGLYAIRKLRDELGLTVQAFEAAEGAGGTWFYNRYPGARCDIESVHYSYSFDEDLQREWRWTERFAGQPEILAYLEHVADRFDLRRSIRFETRVTSAVWDDDAARWTVETDDGTTVSAQFVVCGQGNLSVPADPRLPGLDRFAGRVLRTSSWPHEGVDVTGLRVAVFGTGSTGIQVIPEMARQASHLTVFQRTPNFAAPLGNAPVSDEEHAEIVARYPEIRARSKETFLGTDYPDPLPSALAASEEERREIYDRYWATGSFRILTSTYADLLFDETANATIADYIRERIRERIDDPQTAEMLVPTDHPYGTKRAPFETDYYDTFNQPHVRLVDVRRTPVTGITENAVMCGDEEHPVDVIVLATGFDAVSGPLMKLGLVGRDGLKLTDAWADGPRTYLGLGMHGFPNLFTITGPQCAVVLQNNPQAIEEHVELTAAAIRATLDAGNRTFEVTREAQDAWFTLVSGLLELTLFPRANSWYMGDNIEGKPRTPIVFPLGAPFYRAICTDMVARGWAGFAFDGIAQETSPQLELDPPVALLLAGLASQGVRPLEELELDEARELLETFALLQAPGRDLARVQDTTFPAPGGDRPARVFVPHGEGPFPVLVWLHPGGWVAGSIAMADEPCRALADDLGAIVVAPSYRLAPEAPFPAAIEDAQAAVAWAADAIASFGGDPARIAIGGESAGANLATVVARRCRDAGGPALAAQVLLYPPIDPQALTESRERHAAGPIVSAKAAELLWTLYLGDPANATSPDAVPSRADLAGLPAALVLSMGCDPLRDEAEAYAEALRAAGVDTVARRHDGLIHATFSMSAHVPRVEELRAEIASFLAPRLGTRAAQAPEEDLQTA